jgi:hypothetical protein
VDEQQRDPGLILDVARDRLARQLATADSLDSRGGVVFAVGSALVGILAAIVVLRPVPNWESSAALWGAVAAYFALTGTLLFAFWPREWEDGPSEDHVAVEWKNSTNHQAALMVARTLSDARKSNQVHVDRKVTGLSVSLWCLVALTAFLLLLAWFATPALVRG